MIMPTAERFAEAAIEILGPTHPVALIFSFAKRCIAEAKDITITQIITNAWKPCSMAFVTLSILHT